MSDALFHLEELTFWWPDQPPLLQGLSLTIAPEDRILIRGANGSGKSTLLNLLVGNLKPRSGSLLLKGKAPSEQPPEAFRELVYCRQKATDDLFGLILRHDLECWRLAWPTRFTENQIKKLDDSLLSLLETPYSRLSTGELRALTLLWLPLLQDKFWLLDEPTAGLDTARKESFTALCQAKKDSGYLFVSHSPALPAKLFNRILELDKGVLRDLK